MHHGIWLQIQFHCTARSALKKAAFRAKFAHCPQPKFTRKSRETAPPHRDQGVRRSASVTTEITAELLNSTAPCTMQLALNIISQLPHLAAPLGSSFGATLLFGAGWHSMAHMAQQFHPPLAPLCTYSEGEHWLHTRILSRVLGPQVEAARTPAMLVEPPPHQKHLEPSSLQQCVPGQEQSTAYMQLDKVPAPQHQPRKVPLHWP